MLPQTLPLTDFKKDYKFLWSIDGSSASGDVRSAFGNGDDNVSLKMMKQFTLDNPIYCTYISQLAEEVKLPDDEFEIEPIANGPVTYEIPKKVKLANIVVTYLEDSVNSVYNFHKTWYNMIRGGTGVYFNQPTKLCAVARYVEFENTLTAGEYTGFFGAYRNYLADAIASNISARTTLSLRAFMESMKPEVPYGAKPTGTVEYPRIYPTRISRSAANKGGSSLHKVTVTYSRVPTFKKPHTNLQRYNDVTFKWENVVN